MTQVPIDSRWALLSLLDTLTRHLSELQWLQEIDAFNYLPSCGRSAIRSTNWDGGGATGAEAWFYHWAQPQHLLWESLLFCEGQRQRQKQSSLHLLSPAPERLERRFTAPRVASLQCLMGEFFSNPPLGILTMMMTSVSRLFSYLASQDVLGLFMMVSIILFLHLSSGLLTMMNNLLLCYHVYLYSMKKGFDMSWQQ